ncbi:hypothetical protein CXF68_00375 [Tenacibaculum sp. Bg11-29]|uniref:hypothetical protein n=1 Tax=Tenacibaculum sp. Bg11-29 TaxID=2058306 RepID=UPI000C32EB82|nr:hypothetical protein [Tenacibaculum sp. Bg11-29]PKH49235.1 hypothetical protein CXF68_00375 [Tenacibaculum sp. Bg11-29]
MSTPIFKKKILLVLLFVATVFSFIYAFNKSYDYKVVSSKLKKSVEEKNELQLELDEKIASYKKLAVKNKKLSKRVISEINKIIDLKDSVDDLDNDLKKDKNALTQKITLTKKLYNKVNYLASKIDKARLLKVNISEILTVKKRNSGKFTKTTNKNKVDAFKVSFYVLENEMATPGKKRVSIKILDSQNNVVVTKSGAKNNLIVDYKNESLSVTSYVEFDRENVKAGRYKVIISIEGLSAGQKTINLG